MTRIQLEIENNETVNKAVLLGNVFLEDRMQISLFEIKPTIN